MSPQHDTAASCVVQGGLCHHEWVVDTPEIGHQCPSLQPVQVGVSMMILEKYAALQN